VVHAVGAPFPDADHKKNFDTVVKLLAPGKPEQSKFLLKPLAQRDGGLPHEGGDRIFKGTAAYRAWVDFINGVKGKAPAKPAPPAVSATTTPGQPDFGYFVSRIEPTLQGVCSQCHAGKGRGQLGLVVHAAGKPFPLADHRKNYDTVLRLLVPGKPEQSKFLLKPLAQRDGGVAHEGGDRIFKGDPNHRAWTEFIQGAVGPPPPEDAPPEEELPAVVDRPMVLEATSLGASGDVSVTDGPAGKAVTPGPGGGRVSGRFRVGRTGDYAVSLRLSPGARGARVRIDGGEAVDVDAPKGAVGDAGPRLPLDNGKPLDGRAGRLAIGPGGALAMDGRDGMARFLAAADLPHTACEAEFTIPSGDDPGRDDAWLLFDCLNEQNGKFFGLSDGGRRVVMGVIEFGRPRVLRSIPRPEGLVGERLRVDLDGGVAFGRLDGKPVLFVNFDRGLGAARFGFLTHGTATVKSMTAYRGTEEVHRMRLTEGAVFHLARGQHRIEIELLPGGAAFHAVTLKDAQP
jgi:hypothetical protein